MVKQTLFASLIFFTSEQSARWNFFVFLLPMYGQAPLGGNGVAVGGWIVGGLGVAVGSGLGVGVAVGGRGVFVGLLVGTGV